MGIRKGFPWIRKRFGRVTSVIQLIRPFTLLAPIIAGLIGVLTPVKEITLDHVVTGIYVGITLALAQACGQCINQYADSELDSLIKPYRPIPSGLMKREEALGISWLLALIAIGRAFTISIFFGTVILILLFFAIFYSLAPFSPRKIHPVLNVTWMGISRGFLPVLAVFSIYGELGIFNASGRLTNGLIYSILGFLWVTGFQSTKDIDDVEGDKKFGIKTIPSAYGVVGLRICMAISLLLLMFFAIVFDKLLMLTMSPLGLTAIVVINKRSEITENNYGWVIFYTGLAFLYLLMFFERL